MYCKHCYKMIEDGTTICPFCGKDQSKRDMPGPLKTVLRILLGIGVWMGSMLLIAIIGSTFGFANNGGFVSTLYSISVVVLPVLLAFKIALPRKTTNPAKVIDTQLHAQTTVDDSPLPHSDPVPQPAQPEKAQISEEKDEAVEAIVQSLRDGTYHETMHELFGDEYPDTGKTKTYKVTGMQHYMDNIMFLARENPYYEWTKKELISAGMTDERIWKYEFYPKKLDLLPEPDNPYDPNAIKVLIDDEHVGYIKRGSCSHVLKLIENEAVIAADCVMGGGPYKYIYEDSDDGTYIMEKDESPFFVHLKITERT